jgi:hypothetical protein
MGENSSCWQNSAHGDPEAKMTRKQSGEGVPALQNEDVTGMSDEKQDEVIRESGRAPRRKAAEEFYDEQQDQAADTKPGDAKRR